MTTNDFSAHDAQNSLQGQNDGLFSRDVQVLGTIGTSFISDVLKVQRNDSIHAIKILNEGASQDPDLVEMFLKNARYNQSLNEFTSVKIEEIVEGKRPFYVMSNVAESNLKDVIRQHSPLDGQWLFSLLLPISKMLDTIHHGNAIHGNIKPSNLLIQADAKHEKFLLTDYLEPSLSSTSATITGAGPYCAPEFRTGMPISNRSDVYSLAAVAYEAMTGYLPHGPYQDHDGNFHVWRTGNEIRDPRLLNPFISPALSKLLLASLSTNAIERPNSCPVFVEEALRSYEAPKASVVAPKEIPVEENPPVPMLLIVAGVFLSILLLFGAYKVISSMFSSSPNSKDSNAQTTIPNETPISPSTDPEGPRDVTDANRNFLSTLSIEQQNCSIQETEKRWTLSISTLHCPYADPVAATDPSDLWYANFKTIPDLNASYEGTAQTILTNALKAGGTKVDNDGSSLPCAVNPNETGKWDGRAIRGDANSAGGYGKFTCVSVPIPKIIWTDEEKHSIGEATFENKSLADLTQWWSTKSGPAKVGNI